MYSNPSTVLSNIMHTFNKAKLLAFSVSRRFRNSRRRSIGRTTRSIVVIGGTIIIRVVVASIGVGIVIAGTRGAICASRSAVVISLHRTIIIKSKRLMNTNLRICSAALGHFIFDNSNFTRLLFMKRVELGQTVREIAKLAILALPVLGIQIQITSVSCEDTFLYGLAHNVMILQFNFYL